MAEEAKNIDVSSLTDQLDEALTSLDSALLQAGRSVATIRSFVPQFSELAASARQMEEAMVRAREQLNLPTAGATHGTAAPPLRPVPVQEPQEQIEEEPSTSEPEPEFQEPVAEEIAQPQAEEEPDAPTVIPTTGEPNFSSARCLRLDVTSKTGSLDLKAVDGSVNENPSVIDVALLDYDGRQATLKLWINESSDPEGVRDALLSSLRSHLGDEKEAEISIDLEEGPAA